VLNETFASKPVKASVATVVLGAKWYQSQIPAFTPSPRSEVVKLYGRWIVFAMQVMAQSTT
jgi:hypothetical protein